jgi:hypothetical protein
MRERFNLTRETVTNAMQRFIGQDSATSSEGTNSSSRHSEDAARADGAGGGDHGHEHEQSNVGILLHTNTFADVLEVEGHLQAAYDTFNRHLPVEHIGDVPFKRNLTRIERTLPLLEPELEEAMLRLTKQTDHIISPSTVGTGFIAFQWADLGPQFSDTIDVVVTGDKTHPDTLQQKAQNTLLAGVGHGMIEPPVILCDHRAGEIRFQDVAPEIAHAIVANAHTDLINRSVGYWTMSYQHIPLGGMTDMEISETLRDVVDEATPWISTGRWCPWADQSMSVPLAAGADSYVILPTNVQLGQNEDIRVCHRPDVSGAHVLNFWPLETAWVEQHIRRAGVEFVDQQLRAGDNRIATVWAQHAAPRDPLDEWERLRAEYIDPRLPEE